MALRGAAWRGGLGSLIGATVACSGPAEPCVSGDPCEFVQVATWWGTRGELFLPFNVLKESLSRATPLEASLAHPFVSKSDHTAWVETQLDSETTDPMPLDVFSANNGDEVLRWTPCGAAGNPGAARLHGLTRPELGVSAFDSTWIEDTFPPEVMSTLQCMGETYALPVGIHRINTLLYNKQLFRDAGYAIDGEPGRPLPSTLEELHAAAAALAEHLPQTASDVALQPSVIAVAGREAWTLSLFVIENLMLSLAESPKQYMDYWMGDNCDDSLLKRTLEEFVRLRPWFGSFELSSSDAINRVTNGQAAMMVTGDWAAAEPALETIGTIPFPGTANYFVFSADVFALPDLPSADATKGLAWLRAVTGQSTQREFSVAKNALPARKELQGELASGLPGGPEWLRSLPAIMPYAPDAPFLALQDELQSWLYSGEQTGAPVLEYARAEYSKLPRAETSCALPSVDIDDPR